jgi:parvulin-like peptidyl-prolyl isomerase
VALVAACSSGGGDGPPEVAATVDGTKIESAEVERLLDQYRNASEAAKDKALAAEEAPKTPLEDEVGRRFVLEFMIRLKVLEELAAEKGISSEAGNLIDAALDQTSDADFAGTAWTANDLKEGLEAGALSKALAEKLFPEVAVSDAEVNTHWEAIKDNFTSGWNAKVRAAFLPTAQAGEQLREAVAGGADFDAKAKELAALQVGSMGTVSSTSAEVSPQLRAIIADLQPGEMSVPTAAAGGFVVLLAEEREEVPERTLAEVRDQVVAAVSDQKRQRLFLDWLDEQVKKADVTVDAYYGRWNRERGTVSAG